MTTHSLELAAQAWCEPETSHKVMDEALCKAFARILDCALAQSDAEPVVQTEFELEDGLHELAFPAPPRPDASAGMIEALEALVIDCENKWGDPHTLAEARATLTTIRARAADRSGKPAMTEMTDEERERLCAKLRREFYDGEYAASEIERLAALVRSDAEPESYGDQLRRVMKRQAMQSDAEPDSNNLEEMVSRWEALKDGGGPSAPWGVLQDELLTIISLARKGLTAPPRPDASAEPVAWQKVREVLEAARLCLKSRDQSPQEARVREAIESILDTAPPRPDASAGLIEAAEWLEQRAPACYAATTAREWAAELRKEVAVRSRAADRSGK